MTCRYEWTDSVHTLIADLPKRAPETFKTRAFHSLSDEAIVEHAIGGIQHRFAVSSKCLPRRGQADGSLPAHWKTSRSCLTKVPSSSVDSQTMDHLLHQAPSQQESGSLAQPSPIARHEFSSAGYEHRCVSNMHQPLSHS